jgi:hypothetical protein
LCERCAKIDFKAMFASQEMPQSGFQIVLDLGIIDKNSSCPLCQLFLAKRGPTEVPMWARAPAGRKDESWAILCRVFESNKSNMGGAQSRQPGVGLRISSTPAWKPQPTVIGDYIGDMIFPEGSSPTFGALPGTVEAVRIDPAEVNYDRLQDWLRRCDEKHTGTCCRLPCARPVEISCIDCYTRQIVPISPDDEYIALSYVWGSRSVPEPPIGNMLPAEEKLSLVIRDAMTVVRRLGKRYVWVDQYCIDQANPELKSRQIRHMDQVYERAYATIVAAAGSGAEFGIPGVSSRPRTAQMVAETSNVTLVGASPSLATDLEQGAWIDRGWTYQETVLSRRLVIFTEHQAHFVCSAMTCCESLLTAVDDICIGQGERPITLRNSDLFSTVVDFWRPVSPWSQTLLGQLLDHIYSYSTRTLTYQSDGLNALRGILSRWPFHSYYGTPFGADDAIDMAEPLKSPEHQLGFLRTLFWRCRYNAPRKSRPGFPSWSWVSSQEGAVLDPPVGDVRLPMARILVDRLARGHEHGAAPQRMLPELSPELHLETLVVRLRFQAHPEGHGQVGILCRCHPSGAHEVGNAREEIKRFLDESKLAVPIFTDEISRERIAQTTWDCALLYTNKLWSSDPVPQLQYRAFLILEWRGAVAYRVGTLAINDDRRTLFETLLKDIPHETRTITLV